MIDPLRRQVEAAYQHNNGGPSAYIDESYRAFERPGEEPFYVLTAVIVEYDDMEPMRTELVRIAGGNYWHTTKELRTDLGRKRVHEMLNYLADGIEPCVISTTTSISSEDDDLEGARRACVQQLLAALATGGDSWTSVNLALMEQRKFRNQRNRDDDTYRKMHASGHLRRDFRLLQTSPSCESLLWLPDLVSSAIRRSMALSDPTYFEVVSKNVYFL